MKQQMCKITIQGTEREYPRETTFQQIADEYQSQMENDIVLVKFQQDLRELHQSVLRDGELEFITTAEKPGRDTYRRSIKSKQREYHKTRRRRNIYQVYPGSA